MVHCVHLEYISKRLHYARQRMVPRGAVHFLVHCVALRRHIWCERGFIHIIPLVQVQQCLVQSPP